MKAVKLETDKAPQPGGWYSQAFRVGDLIYTAGVTANDPVTGKLVAPGDIVGQTRQILKNMDALLKAHGSDLQHVFKTLVFVDDIFFGTLYIFPCTYNFIKSTPLNQIP